VAVPHRTVSVIVPNYNYEQFLPQRISSIVNQTYPIHEIIVLDDASTDDSVSVIREIARRLGREVRIVVNKENSGSIAQQWLRGVGLATGELVWIAEADDLADNGFLAGTVGAFDSPNVVLSYCQSRQINSDGIVLDKDYSAYLDDFDPHRWQHDYCRPGTEEIADMLCVGNTIPNMSAVVFSRTALMRVLSAYREELLGLRIAVDWCCYLRLLSHGSIAFTAQVLNSHRRHQSSVISTINAQLHLHEIERMQQLAAELVDVSPERAIAARLWYAAWAEMAISASPS
jgi:glycosyltransferase involved in cell wall biosynthesis